MAVHNKVYTCSPVALLLDSVHTIVLYWISGKFISLFQLVIRHFRAAYWCTTVVHLGATPQCCTMVLHHSAAPWCHCQLQNRHCSCNTLYVILHTETSFVCIGLKIIKLQSASFRSIATCNVYNGGEFTATAAYKHTGMSTVFT